MKKIIHVLLITALALVLQNCSFTTANLQDVKMCNELSGDACSGDNSIFSVDDPMLYVSCSLHNAPDDTKVNFTWFYTTGERFEIDAVSVTTDGSGSTYPLYSSLSAPYEGWPEGDYEVVIAIEGYEDKTVTKTFKVR